MFEERGFTKFSPIYDRFESECVMPSEKHLMQIKWYNNCSDNLITEVVLIKENNIPRKKWWIRENF